MSDYVLMNFAESIESAENSLRQGIFDVAFSEAANVITTLLSELYAQEVMRLPFLDRQQVLEEEKQYRDSRHMKPTASIFTLGNWIGFFENSTFLEKWATASGAEIPQMDEFILEIKKIGHMRNAVIHHGATPTKTETENMVAFARSFETIVAPVLTRHHTFDYRGRMAGAEGLLLQNRLREASMSCFLTIEVALRDIYIRNVMRLPYLHRSEIVEREKEYRDFKGLSDGKFTVDDWVAFYLKSGSTKRSPENRETFTIWGRWKDDLGIDKDALEHLRIDMNYIGDMRNKVLKTNFKPIDVDAERIFGFAKLLIRTFRLMQTPTISQWTDIVLTNDSEDIRKRFQHGTLFQTRQVLAEHFVQAVYENPVTYLIGPTGYGKTRLLWELRNELGKSKGIWIDCEKMSAANQCVEYITQEIRDFDTVLDNSAEQLTAFLSGFDGLLILDNFEYCLASSGNPDIPIGMNQHWLKHLSGNFDVAGKNRWLKEFIEQAMTQTPSPLRIVVLSQVVPNMEPYHKSNDMSQYPEEIDVAQYPLDDRQSEELLLSLDAKHHKLPHDRETLQQVIEYCGGIPAALELVATLAHKTDIIQFISNPDFTSIGTAQKLIDLISLLVGQFEEAPEVIVLRALALLGMRFKKGHVLPDKEDLGIARLAGMLDPTITQKQVNDTLNMLLKTRCIMKYEGVTRAEDEFAIAPIFGRAILETISSLTLHEQLVSYGSLAIFLGNVLESFPTQSARSSQVVLTAFYKLQTDREQTIVGRWLWAILKRHEVVETQDPHEIRRSAHSVLIAISSFAAKLHFWWTMYIPLEAYGQILRRIENALRVAEDSSESANSKKAAFFGMAHELVQQWVLLERNYPRESAWTSPIAPSTMDTILQCIVRIRRILKRYDPAHSRLPSIEAKRSKIESPEQSQPTETLLSDYGAIFKDYQDVLAILSHLEGEMYRCQGRHDASIQKQNEAIDAFSENMSWGKPYLLYSRAESEFPLGKRSEGFQSCFDAILTADGDVEAIAWSWKDIGVELLNAKRFSSALKALCLAAAYAFRQLPNPSYGGPVFRVDEYNIVFYRHMCDLLILAFRQVYSLDKNVRRTDFIDIQELWRRALTAADQAKNPKTGEPISNGDKTPSKLEARENNSNLSLQTLLTGWQSWEESHLKDADQTLRQTYDAVAAHLDLPRTPMLDIGEYENANEYYIVNTTMWEEIEASLEDMAQQVKEDIEDLLTVKR